MREVSSGIAYEIHSGETLPLKVARSTKLGRARRRGLGNTQRRYRRLLAATRPHAEIAARRTAVDQRRRHTARDHRVFSAHALRRAQALNSFARVVERLAARMRRGWRTV